MKKLSVLLLFCLYGSFFSSAQSLYGLDPTFANNGIYLGDTGSFGKIAIQNDDKILALGGGKAHLMRFNSNGTIDNSFASNGYFSILFPKVPYPAYPIFYSLTLQSDGKILLGGIVDTVYTNASNPNGGNQDFLLVRLNSNGSLDSSFSGGGYVITSYQPYNPLGNSSDKVVGIVLQTDGKIMALGDSNIDTIMVIRYNPDGSFDSSFGFNGKVKLIQNFDYPTANDIAIMPDGRIVIGAETNINALNGATAFTAIRLLPDGRLDTSFNHTGVAYTNGNLPGLLYCKVMSLQPDGKVLLGGYADSLAIARFDTSGQLDNSFGNNGLVKLDPAGKMRGLLVLPNGKILIAGTLDTSTVLYRLNIDGSLDSSFGMNGRITTKILDEKNKINGLGVQSTGKIIAAGNGENFPYPNNFPTALLIRYTANATATHDIDINSDLSIYPNPAYDYISIDNKTHHRIQQLSLYSSEGKLFLTQFSPNTNRLSTEGLAAGMYYLHILFANHQQLTKKIIIQKK